MSDIALDKINCKICGSPKTVKDGLIKGVQRWECKDCGCKFLDNGALPGMKTPFIQAASALRMHYEGMSLNRIRRQLQNEFRVNPSRSSIFKWTNIYPNRVLEAVENCRPQVGDTWVAVETTSEICNRRIWIWDIIDKETLFLLATKVSSIRSAGKLHALVDQAVERAGQPPKTIAADTLAGLLQRSARIYHRDVKSPQGYSFEISCGFPVKIEVLKTGFQERAELIQGFKSIERAVQFTYGWLAHYNYFNRRDSLGGRTPAEIANIEYPQLRVEYLKASRQR